MMCEMFVMMFEIILTMWEVCDDMWEICDVWEVYVRDVIEVHLRDGFSNDLRKLSRFSLEKKVFLVDLP